MVKDKPFREDLYYRLNVVRIETPPLRNRMEDLPELIDFMLQRLDNEYSTGTTEISKDAFSILQQYNWPGNVRELENVLHSSSVVSKGKRILLKDLPEILSPLFNSITDENKTDELLPADNNNKSLVTEEKNDFRSESLDQKVSDKIGSNKSVPSNGPSLDSPPKSISLKESYDIAYAHTRELTDSNLLELVEKEMIQRSLTESGGNQVKASGLLGITRATLRKRIDMYGIRY